MSLLTDNSMRRYVHKTTGREVVLMQSVETVGDFIRKDVWEKQKPAVTEPAPIKVAPTPAPSTVKLVAHK